MINLLKLLVVDVAVNVGKKIIEEIMDDEPTEQERKTNEQ